jgi:hypothetical protein
MNEVKFSMPTFSIGTQCAWRKAKSGNYRDRRNKIIYRVISEIAVNSVSLETCVLPVFRCRWVNNELGASLLFDGHLVGWSLLREPERIKVVDWKTAVELNCGSQARGKLLR